jgi:hypothetical protein
VFIKNILQRTAKSKVLTRIIFSILNSLLEALRLSFSGEIQNNREERLGKAEKGL